MKYIDLRTKEGKALFDMWYALSLPLEVCVGDDIRSNQWAVSGFSQGKKDENRGFGRYYRIASTG